MRPWLLSLAVNLIVSFEAMAGGLCLESSYADVPAAGTGRAEFRLNGGWLFCGRDIGNGQAVDLDESAFRRVCLPHTIVSVNRRSVDTASWARVTWYRRHFTAPGEWAGKRIFVEFQAVATVARVYCNGEPVGEHKGAYTPFTFDITDFMKAGADNILAVRVDSRQRKDVPPEGVNVDYMLFGGIVRNVNLIVTGPLRIDWVYARSDTARPDRIIVTARVVNDGKEGAAFFASQAVIDSSGSTVAAASDTHTVSADSALEFSAVLGPIPSARLWHPDHPFLYSLLTKVKEGDAIVDDCRTRFGLRRFSFDKTSGKLSINGSPLRLRGLNRHETYPFIGRAAADRLQEKDADIIKFDFGCNVVRCSHYPQSPAFLDRCDEIGLLVLEEMPGWLFVSTDSAWQALSYASVGEMIMRDRNHPSILSFGVRINESADFHRLYTATNDLARRLDPGRPTHGVRVLGRGCINEFLEDIWCQNFAIPAGKPPVLPWITTEAVGHRIGSIHSWDDESRRIGQMLAHAAALDSAGANPNIAGLLGWCAFDYYSPYRYADSSVCYHGVADMFRLPKHAGFFYRSQTDPARYGPMVYIAHSWKRALKPDNDVWVASNCDTVELFVNGQSKGRRAPDEYRSLEHPLFVWHRVAFEAGEIKAVGFIRDTVAAVSARRTPETAVRLVLAPDDTVLKTNGDMTRVVLAAVDPYGQSVPFTKSAVTVAVKGNADFIGESPIALEGGKTAFYVKTGEKPGIVSCRASGKGLAGADIRIKVQSMTIDKKNSLQRKNQNSKESYE